MIITDQDSMKHPVEGQHLHHLCPLSSHYSDESIQSMINRAAGGGGGESRWEKGMGDE